MHAEWSWRIPSACNAAFGLSCTPYRGYALGEIGDANTAPALMVAAEDANMDRGTRANAIVSLGRMKAQAAAPLMERLARDGDTNIAYHAAAALARIKEVSQTQPSTATSRPGEWSPRRPDAAPTPPAR